MAVEPRKYRMRLLNGAVSRSMRPLVPVSASANSKIAFALSLHQESDGNALDFDVIASDAGMLALMRTFFRLS
jgi:hypothetical protein